MKNAFFVQSDNRKKQKNDFFVHFLLFYNLHQFKDSTTVELVEPSTSPRFVCHFDIRTTVSACS